MQCLQCDEKAIEDVVCGKHGHQTECNVGGKVNDAIRQQTNARHNPAQSKHIERDISYFLLLHVSHHFSSLY